MKMVACQKRNFFFFFFFFFFFDGTPTQALPGWKG
jgi:hypothetical protein